MVTLKVSRGQYAGYIVVANPADDNLDMNGFYIRLREQSAPATPAANSTFLYAKDKTGVSNLYFKDDAGVEHDLTGGGVTFPLTPDKNARGNVTGTVTIDLSLSNAHVQTMTLTGNITFVFSNPPASTKNIQFQLDILQDATGGRTITWPASVTVTPAINSGANERTVILCQTSDAGTTYDAFNTSSSASVLNAANRFLSNLDTPTAVNQHLLPDATLVKNLGNTSFRWNEIHLAELRFTSTGTLDGTIPEITTSTGNIRIGVATAKLIELMVNAATEYEFSSTNLDLKSNTLSGIGATMTGSTTTNILRQDINGWSIEVGTGDTIDFSVNSIAQLSIVAGATPKIRILGQNAIEFNAEGSIVTGTTNINRTSTGLAYNALTTKTHRFLIDNTIVVNLSSTKLIISGGNSLNFDTDGSIIAGDYEVRRIANKLNLNCPTGKSITFSRNAVEGVVIVDNVLSTGTGTVITGRLENGSTSSTYIDFIGDTQLEYNVLDTGSTGLHRFEIAGSDRLTIQNTVVQIVADLKILDEDIILGTTTGTKIGTATTQKIGFWNKTPVVQPAAYTVSNPTTDRVFDAGADNLANTRNVLGTLIQDLQSIGILG